MKRTKIKFLIPLVLLFMFIGFATVSSTLGINGDMELLSDLEDFSVYYSRALVNGVEDTSIIKSSTELDFGAALKTVGVDYVIEYDLTNASSAFDAQVSINCSASTEYFSINNEFDSDTPIGARQTRTGTMTLRKIQTVAGDEQNNTISCDIVATPVERTEEGSGEVPIPLKNPYYIGREISIGEEKFNIISDNGDTVTMLAQKALGSNYRQNDSNSSVMFSSDTGWEYTPGPKEIDVQTYGVESKDMINGYLSYLIGVTSDTSLVIDLITLAQLKDLGCTFNDDYSFRGNYTETCTKSPYINWLSNGKWWWLKSASSSDSSYVWDFTNTGTIQHNHYGNTLGIRPTITISKKLAKRLISYKNYDVGDVVTIGTEKFNVIEDNAMSVTMLAQYNLGTDYRQTTTNNYVDFSNTNGWEYSSASEIDIQGWSTNPKLYVNEYVSYLSEYTGDDSLSGDLITLKKLKVLGCNIIDSYSWSSSANCLNTEYDTWLNTRQRWWTKSASTGGEAIWIVHIDKSLQTNIYTVKNGVRPVITISKDALVKYN